MSVNRYKDGQLTLIAGSGDSNTFTGTKAEVEQAIAAGKIKENWTVYITDDLEDIVNTPGSSNCDCKVEYVTQEYYDGLSEEEKMNGTEYRITDNNPATPSAKNMAYDSSVSGIEATNVQDAIDAVSGNVKEKVFTEFITEYEGLGDMAIWKVHSEKLKDNQPIIARIKVASASAIMIGMRITATRGRYITMYQTSSGITEYRVTDTELVKTAYSGTTTNIALT